MAKKISAIAADVYDILEPLEPADRMRVVQAALTLLGEPSQAPVKGSASSPEGNIKPGTPGIGNPSPKTQAWIKQNGLLEAELEQAFHFEADGTVQVIASTVPGDTNSERCRNAYLLVGAAQLLASGEPNFFDKAARDQCTKVGSYDSTNHGKFLQKMGNEFAGNKAKGWTLTGPGLRAAASLIKELAGPAQ